MRSLRRRLVALATVGVVLALLGASVFVVVTVRGRLTSGVDEEIERRIADIENRIRSDSLPSQLSTVADRQDAVIQVVVDGAITASTDNALGLAPLDRACGSGPDVTRFPSVDNSPYRITTSCIEIAEVTYVVHVAVNRDDVDESVRALRLALVVAVPIVSGILSFALWWLVGRLLRRVEAAAEREARFVADAAHELRSPLARMITALEVDGPQATDSVLSDARDLARLTDDLLTLARLDSAAALRREALDFDDVVFRVVEGIRPTVGAIVFELVGVSAAQVVGDARLLERVVENLLDNAARFARASVVLTLRAADGMVEFVVADDGPGVDPAKVVSIFDRFARADDARTPGRGGTGLGLAIVRAIVEAHHGTVDYEPSPNGARFRVRLPSATDD